MTKDYGFNLKDVSHQEIYRLIKCTTAAETKVDLLADLIYKLIINDIHTLQREVKELQKFQWKCAGAVGVVVVILQLVFKAIFK